MTLLYKPLALAFSVIGGLAAGAIFKRTWRLVAGEDEAPSATNRSYSWSDVLLAAALEGAVFGLVKAAIDRGGAQGFQAFTGVWPGDDSDDDKEA